MDGKPWNGYLVFFVDKFTARSSGLKGSRSSEGVRICGKNHAQNLNSFEKT
jgi:hypothetical protein